MAKPLDNSSGLGDTDADLEALLRRFKSLTDTRQASRSVYRIVYSYPRDPLADERLRLAREGRRCCDKGSCRAC
jgi:hypothetical protein